MARRSITSSFIALLALLILSRHITGVPGAQVEIFRSLVVNTHLQNMHSIQFSTTSVHDLGSPELLTAKSSSAQCLQKTTSAKKDNSNEQKSTYKSYVSPDKIIFNYHLKNFTESNYQSTSFTQFWLFSTLPQVIHANSPPINTTPSPYPFNTPLTMGDRDNYYEAKSCSDNRGVCINCIRP